MLWSWYYDGITARRARKLHKSIRSSHFATNVLKDPIPPIPWCRSTKGMGSDPRKNREYSNKAGGESDDEFASASCRSNLRGIARGRKWILRGESGDIQRENNLTGHVVNGERESGAPRVQILRIALAPSAYLLEGISHTQDGSIFFIFPC